MDALKTVYRDHPKTALFTAAATLRILLALAFPDLPDLLTDRVEISTPVNSFKRCMLLLRVDASDRASMSDGPRGQEPKQELRW
nr:hypothetical protein CFP56_48681 [Quercus suber]